MIMFLLISRFFESGCGSQVNYIFHLHFSITIKLIFLLIWLLISVNILQIMVTQLKCKSQVTSHNNKKLIKLSYSSVNQVHLVPQLNSNTLLH